MKVDELQAALDMVEYLAKDYEPNQDCVESSYVCDFRVSEYCDECPCQVLLKLKADFYPEIESL